MSEQIFVFLENIYDNIIEGIRTYLFNYVYPSLENLDSWWYHDIIQGDLIHINMTWEMLFNGILPITIGTILIVLFIKFVVKLLGIFSWK